MAVDKRIDSGQLDSDLTSVANAIRAKSGGSSQLAFPSGFVSEIGNIPSGGVTEADPNDVNFIDYDGKILYSYSAADFANLSEMPTNPTHLGLTAQGWNWTLADAKTQVASAGFLDIGQMYVTDDGKTRIYVRISELRKSFTLGVCPNGSVVIDWGDETSANTLTGSSLTTVKYAEHSYASDGEYVITLSVTGSVGISGSGATSYLAVAPTSHNRMWALLCSVWKIELGNNVSIGTYAFFNLKKITSITIPKDTTIIGTDGCFMECQSMQAVVIPSRSDSSDITIPKRMFSGCYSMVWVSFPKKAKSFGDAVFNNTMTLERVAFPNDADTLGVDLLKTTQHCLKVVNVPTSLVAIPSSFLNGGVAVTKIIIPSGVTSIAAAAFYSCESLKEIHFLPSSPPAVANSNAFTSVPTDCIIYVPAGKLSAYTSASNYPSSATYTYVEE